MIWMDMAAGGVLNASSGVLLVLALWMAASMRARTCIVAFGLQSLVIAAQTAALASEHHLPGVWVVAALVVLIKVVAIPLTLLRIVAALKTTPTAAASLSSAQSMFAGTLLILVAYAAVQPYARGLGVQPEALAAAVALILIGGLLMVSRRKAVMQVLGLLVLENGIFLAALTTTLGMPLVVETGIFFDLLMWVFLVGLFVYRIRDTFDHVDVGQLRRLRG